MYDLFVSEKGLHPHVLKTEQLGNLSLLLVSFHAVKLGLHYCRKTAISAQYTCGWCIDKII